MFFTGGTNCAYYTSTGVHLQEKVDIPPDLQADLNYRADVAGFLRSIGYVLRMLDGCLRHENWVMFSRILKSTRRLVEFERSRFNEFSESELWKQTASMYEKLLSESWNLVDVWTDALREYQLGGSRLSYLTQSSSDSLDRLNILCEMLSDDIDRYWST